MSLLFVFLCWYSWALQEREAEFEAEQRRIKKEKELEIARLRAKQEKAKDYKAEQVHEQNPQLTLKSHEDSNCLIILIAH